ARKISASSGASLGRNGRRPAGDLRVGVMAQHPPLQGEGRTAAGSPGWGDSGATRGAPRMWRRCHPLPARKSVGTSPAQGEVVPACCWSLRNLPGGVVLDVLKHHAHSGDFVTDAVGFGEIFSLARRASSRNSLV